MKRSRGFSSDEKKEKRARLGRKFMVARFAKDFTQKEVAEELGIGQSHYQKIEAGNVEPTADQFIKLCMLLNISLEDYTKTSIGKLDRHDTKQHLFMVNPEENFIAMQKTFEAIIKKKDKIISTLRRQQKNLLLDAYGVSV